MVFAYWGISAGLSFSVLCSGETIPHVATSPLARIASCWFGARYRWRCNKDRNQIRKIVQQIYSGVVVKMCCPCHKHASSTSSPVYWWFDTPFSVISLTSSRPSDLFSRSKYEHSLYCGIHYASLSLIVGFVTLTAQVGISESPTNHDALHSHPKEVNRQTLGHAMSQEYHLVLVFDSY